MALTNKLIAIADAIREKTNTTVKYDLDSMIEAIGTIPSNSKAGAVLEPTPSKYPITNKLTALGNAIRAKAGGEEALTLDEMPAIIRSLEEKPVLAEGLEYTLNNDGVSYSCTGIGTCKIKNIIIPNTYNGLPVTAIGKEAFFMTDIRTVIIPNSVTYIDRFAFANCESLLTITIPDSVTQLGSGAFIYCRSLTSATIGSGVTTLYDTFLGCSSLTSVTISNSVTIISAAFMQCRSLASITIPNSVTTIGDGTFGYCHSLTNITIPNSVTTIGENTFFGCENLTDIYIPKAAGAITGAPWGADTTITTIHYNYTA